MQESYPTKAKSSYPEVKNIGNDLKSLQSDVGQLATRVKEEGMHDLSEKAHEGYEGMKVYERKIEERIKDHPLQSLAIAFASGLVANYFFGRR